MGLKRRWPQPVEHRGAQPHLVEAGLCFFLQPGAISRSDVSSLAPSIAARERILYSALRSHRVIESKTRPAEQNGLYKKCLKNCFSV